MICYIQNSFRRPLLKTNCQIRMRPNTSSFFITPLMTGRKVTAVCDESGGTKCDWINLPYKINVASVEVSVYTLSLSY